MHEIHRKYVTTPAQPAKNTFDRFFGSLDKLEPQDREEIVGGTCSTVNFGNDPGAGVLQVLKEKCEELAEVVPEHFVVKSVTLDMLANLSFGGDQENKKKWLENVESMYQKAKEEKEAGEGNEEMLDRIMKDMDKKIDRINKEVARSAALYVLFCEEVVSALLPDPL